MVGGGHCNFAANSFTCSFGELTCGLDLSISREEQHDVVNDFAGLWLDHFLKDDVGALPQFRDSVLTSTRVVGETTCITTGIAQVVGEGWSLSPVPAADVLTIQGLSAKATIEIFDAQGRLVLRTRTQGTSVDVSALPSGPYRLQAVTNGSVSSLPFVVQH